MIAVLAYRHLGEHQPVREISVPGSTKDYVKYVDDPVRGKVPAVDEALLLTFMPAGVLPVPVAQILLIVEDQDADGSSTAVGEPTHFRRWGKYFDAYSLTLTWKDSK